MLWFSDFFLLKCNFRLEQFVNYKTAVKRHLMTAGQSNGANILATCKQIFYLFWHILLYNKKLIKGVVGAVKPV